MTDKYWIGGSGTWNNTLRWCTNYVGTITATCSGAGTSNLNVTAITGTLVAGMTIFYVNGTTVTSLGTLSFVSGGGTGGTGLYTVSAGVATGSVSMTAGTTGATIPTNTDNVFFSQNGTYSVDLSSPVPQCQDFTVNSGIVTITSSYTSNLIFFIYGNFSILSSTIINLVTPTLPEIRFATQTLINKTINTNAASITCSYFSIYYSSVANTVFTLTSELKINGTFNINSGSPSAVNLSFNSAGNTVTARNLYILNSAANFTNSVINLSSVLDERASGIVNGTGSIFTGSTINFNDLTSTSYVNIFNSFTGNIYPNINITTQQTVQIYAAKITNLTIVAPSVASPLRYVTFTANCAITNFSCSGGSALRRTVIQSEPDTYYTRFTLQVTNFVSPQDIDFYAINLTGAGASQTITRCGDIGYNTGVPATPSKQVYFTLSGAQNYEATGWATGSYTGTPNANNFPLPQDEAFINSSTGLTILYINYPYTFPKLNVLGTIDFYSSGSSTIKRHYCTRDFTASLTSTLLNFYVKCLGDSNQNISFKSTNYNLTINKITGTPTVYLSNNTQLTYLILTQGTLNLQSYTLTIGTQSLNGTLFNETNSNTKTLDFSSGQINIYGTGSATGGNTTLGSNCNYAGTAPKIYYLGAGTSALHTISLTYLATYPIDFVFDSTVARVNLNGSNLASSTIKSFKNLGVPFELTISGTSSTAPLIFEDFNIKGSKLLYAKITGGYLQKNTGTVEGYRLNLNNSNVAGGATWYAHNSLNTTPSTNVGWIFDYIADQPEFLIFF